MRTAPVLSQSDSDEDSNTDEGEGDVIAAKAFYNHKDRTSKDLSWSCYVAIQEVLLVKSCHAMQARSNRIFNPLVVHGRLAAIRRDQILEVCFSIK